MGPKESAPGAVELVQRLQKARGEHSRLFHFKLTEQDIWEYIYERVSRLYRSTLPRNVLWYSKTVPGSVDDDRFRLDEDDKIELKKWFRTLGCHPLTGAFESEADRLDDIVLEVLTSRTSERQGRKIDSDSNASMEKKKVGRVTSNERSIQDIATYLEQQAELDLLRFITCGSVDDGKSTLIGRMLYEAQMIFDD